MWTYLWRPQRALDSRSWKTGGGESPDMGVGTELGSSLRYLAYSVNLKTKTLAGEYLSLGSAWSTEIQEESQGYTETSCLNTTRKINKNKMITKIVVVWLLTT